MALVGTIAINMVVKSKAFVKGINSAGSALKKFGGDVAASLFSLKTLVASLAAGAGLYKMVGAASELEAQMGRVKAEFGAGSKDIVEHADTMATAFGVARTKFVKMAADMGGHFKGLGYEAGDAAKLGVHYTELAMDAARRFVLPIDDAMSKLTAAFEGDDKAIEGWGVDLSKGALRARAVAEHLHLVNGKLNEQQKTMMRVAIVEEKLKGLHGETARSTGDAADSTEALIGRISNLGAEIGTALLPIVASVMTQLQVGVEVLSGAWKSMEDVVKSSLSATVGSLGETDKSVGILQKTVGTLADAFQRIKTVFKTVQAYVTWGLSKISGFLTKIAHQFDRLTWGGVKTKLGDKDIGEYEKLMKIMSEELDKSQKKLFDDLDKNKNKPPAHLDVNKEFDDAKDRIKNARDEAAKPGPDPTKFKAREVVRPEKPRFASAAAMGSQEAANAILRSQYGATAGKGKGPEDRTAKNTGEMVVIFKRAQAEARRAGGGGGGGGNIGEFIGTLFGNI